MSSVSALKEQRQASYEGRLHVWLEVRLLGFAKSVRRSTMTKGYSNDDVLQLAPALKTSLKRAMHRKRKEEVKPQAVTMEKQFQAVVSA